MSKWRLFPKITYHDFSRDRIGPNCFTAWLSVRRFWYGRIISVCVKRHQVTLDFRRDWIADMSNGGA